MNHSFKTLACISILLSVLFSCDSEAPIEPKSGDYFPLAEGQTWNYQRWIAFDGDSTILDTLRLEIKETVTFDGKSYAKIIDQHGSTDKLLRVEGSKYYGRDHELYSDGYKHEYLFLDTGKTPGEKWSYLKDDNTTRTEYVIKAVHTTHSFLGKQYDHVIEVQVDYYYKDIDGNFQHSFSVIHFYAPGVGEIYSYYPSPSFGHGDLSSFLMPLE